MTDAAPERITVVIVDDHTMFAQSLGRLLADEIDIHVVGVAASGHEGIDLAAALRPDVVLVDYHLPDRDGISIVRDIKQLAPNMMIVMITGSADDHVLLQAVEAGASAFLTKDHAADEVAEAVRLAAAGESLIPPRDLARLLPKLTRGYQRVGSDLTDREQQILAMLASGVSNPEIAGTLHLSINTVRNYVQAILTKLGAHSKLEAVAVAVKEGLIDPITRALR